MSLYTWTKISYKTGEQIRKEAKALKSTHNALGLMSIIGSV